MALPPSTENHRKVTSVGTSNTPETNSRTVRPREIRAMNTPTNGDQEIHQTQKKMVQLFCQSTTALPWSAVVWNDSGITTIRQTLRDCTKSRNRNRVG